MHTSNVYPPLPLFNVAYPYYSHFVYDEKFHSTLTWGAGEYLFREIPFEANVCGFSRFGQDCLKKDGCREVLFLACPLTFDMPDVTVMYTYVF